MYSAQSARLLLLTTIQPCLSSEKFKNVTKLSTVTHNSKKALDTTALQNVAVSINVHASTEDLVVKLAVKSYVLCVTDTVYDVNVDHSAYG